MHAPTTYDTHPQLRLRYALLKDTDRELRFVDAVETGLKCNCVCPCCGKEVIAKNQGKKKEHHFAHAKGADCTGARMTALHMLAQNVLARDKKVMLPKFEKEYVTHDAELKEFDNVILEKVFKDETSTRKPDCTCYKEGSEKPLWVEIYCRHKVNPERQADIVRREEYCIEIDFKDLLTTEYTENDVVRRLIKDTSNKRWISCPVWDKENEEKRQEAKIEEEKEKRAAEEIREAARQEYKRLKTIVDEWLKQPDETNTAVVIAEIKRKPFSDAYSNSDWCIYNQLVPNGNWVKFAQQMPKTETGKDVFYALVHYYVRANFSHISSDEYKWVWRRITEILRQKSKLRGMEIELECLLVLWVMDRLWKYRNYMAEFSDLGKVFAQNKNIRDYILRNICNLDGNWYNYLCTTKAHELIAGYVQGHEGGTEALTIIQICFPIVTRKSIEQSRQESSNVSERQLYGHDKILAEHHLTETEAWAELNRMFREQEKQRKNSIV